MGKLYALSDVHISHKLNLEAYVDFFTALPSGVEDGNGDLASASPTDDYGYLDSIVYDEYSANSRASSSKKYNFTQDGLILAGDLGEKLEHLRLCFELATQKFKTVWWVPGNHELYTLPGEPRVLSAAERYGTAGAKVQVVNQEVAERDAKLNTVLRGEAKYLECCRIATDYGVLTPEDDFVRWEYDVGPVSDQLRAGSIINRTEAVLVCPLFLLYDYSFRPDYISRDYALEWAEEQGVQATDEALLHPDPYPTRDEWCWSLVRKAEAKLIASQSQGLPLVLINHWPLREDLIHIPLIPRFTLWCGTKLTHDWHKQFNAKVVISGHLHVRRTDWRDDCRFEEVSLGYPRQWEQQRSCGRTVGDIMRVILPGEDDDNPVKPARTIWKVQYKA